MKKLLALTMALLMALSCMSAFADTIYTKVLVDEEVAESLMALYGMEEDQMALVDTILSLVNALGVNVITAEDGAQVDVDLNGADAFSLGFATNEAGATVVSTLFPNYALTVSQETMGEMMKQFAANMPSAGGEGGVDMTAMTEVLSRYVTPWIEACAAAGKPGDPVTGDYGFEGCKFDTMVPVTVDMEAITEATKKLVDDIMADPAAMGMIKGYVMTAAQKSGQTIDEAKFEEDFKAAFEEWMSHFPKTATAEYYTNANSDGTPFYMYGEAMREGETEPFTCYMYYEDANHMHMGYQDGEVTEGAFTMDGSDMSMYFQMGVIYFGLDMSFSEELLSVSVYFMSDESPLLTLLVTTTKGGERTLSMDTAGKTVLAVEDIMQDQSGEAVQGLLGDFMTNGLGTLMNVLSEQVPEIAAMLGMFSGMMAG